MIGRHYDSPSFAMIDTFRATSKTWIAAKPDFDKDDGHLSPGYTFAHNEIDFTEFATIVSGKHFHPFAMQVIFRQSFRPGTAFAGGHGVQLPEMSLVISG